MEPMVPEEPRNIRGKTNNTEEDDRVSVRPESARCKVDSDHMLGIVGIVGTFLNLLVVVLVYMYTPI